MLSSSLLWNWSSGGKASCFVKAVGSLFGSDSLASKIFSDGLEISVGNGCRASFWHDPLVMNTPLKSVCPRMFALAVNKEGKVADFGMWCGSIWKWEVPLRRTVFG